MHNTPTQIFFWVLLPVIALFVLYQVFDLLRTNRDRDNSEYIDEETAYLLKEELFTLFSLTRREVTDLQLWYPSSVPLVLEDLRLINNELAFADATEAPTPTEGDQS